MVLGNFQSEGRELHEVIGIHRHKAPELRRKDQWWRTAEIHKTELPFGTYFTVEHGRNFTRLVVRIAAQSIARSDGLRQTEINVLE